MSDQTSFTALEHTFRAELRDKLDKSESTTDMEMQFARVVAGFLREVFKDMEIADEDVRFVPGAPPYYALSPGIQEAPEYQALLTGSDLQSILERFADKANHDYVHRHGRDEQGEIRIRNPMRD